MKCLYSTIYFKGVPSDKVLCQCAKTISNRNEKDIIVTEDIFNTSDTEKTYAVRQRGNISGFSEILIIDDGLKPQKDSETASIASRSGAHVFAQDESFINDVFVLIDFLDGKSAGVVKFNESEDGCLYPRT